MANVIGNDDVPVTIPEEPRQTLRMQIADQEDYAHKKLARLETAKAKLPAAWLDMTDREIRDQFGIEIYL